MKKILALLLAALMLSALTVSASAAVLPLLSDPVPQKDYMNFGSQQAGFADRRPAAVCPVSDPALIPMTAAGLCKIENETAGDGVTTVSAGYAMAGDVVKVTAVPAEGMTLEVIAVMDAQNNEQKLEVLGGGVYTFVMPEAMATVHTVYVPAEETEPATRGDVAEALWLMAGQPYVNYAMTFEDVEEGSDQAEAIRWAAALGLMNGYSAEKFGADDGITREQLCAVLYRYAETFDEGFKGAWVFLLPYADRMEVSEWASVGVHWCCMKQIVEADEDGNLNPAEVIGAEEAAAMIAGMALALAD